MMNISLTSSNRDCKERLPDLPVQLSILRTFGLILVSLLILPEFIGAAGVWPAVLIAELITMVVALIFLYRNKDRYHYA